MIMGKKVIEDKEVIECKFLYKGILECNFECKF